MKKNVIIFGFILIFACFSVIQAAAQARAGGTMFVAVKTAELKSGTGFFASGKGSLNYGDKVSVISISGNFAEVRSADNASLTGWLALANLTAKQVVAGSTANVSASETAMAGKGFNAEVEATYKEQNRTLNFADVDRVEAIQISEADLRKFLEEGRLRMGE